MTQCVPIREMKDTARFSKLVEEAAEPITVTKNGYDHLVVMTTDVYQKLEEQIVEAKLLVKIAHAEADIASGKLVDGEAFISSMRKQYGY